ncbi:uncharacterized protein [Venturia canescens]|uniref:uncharacterized protein n=1 Tax=Venturia canescens TaxID=32260 RepID=UPI001C9BC122|nr:uncharacterized protein LOC122413832 [Venturia canescens]
MKNWEVVVLIETWQEEKGAERISGRLPKGYKWKRQWAKRENRRGRAKGGMWIGISERLEIIEERNWEEEEEQGIITGRVKAGEDTWTIVGVYVQGDMGKKIRKMRQWIERQEKLVEETGWEILTGNIEGDEEGEYTYTGGRGETVIDYVIGDERTRGKVRNVIVEDRVESDHQPLVVTIRKGGRKKGGRVEREIRKGKGGKWSERKKEEYRRKMERIEWEEGDIQATAERTKEKIKRVMRESEEIEEEREQKKRGGWWDEECIGRKMELRRALRGWREERVGREEYGEKRREHKELCEAKKKEEQDRLIREIAEARTEEKVWEIVNRGRKIRKKIDERISLEEWKRYFMELLGGREQREERRIYRERQGQEEEISREEIKKAIKKIKAGKSVGGDGIPNEAWKYGGKRTEERAWEICRRVWRGEGWPKEWEEGIIVPIVKKGEGKRVEEYRGVTVMLSLYKIYATVLARRLEREIEEKGIVPPNQTGFRRGTGTIDSIYVMNYLVGRRCVEKKGKVIAMFVDLKAAFDSVDRKVLVETMEKRGVREGIRERVREIYEETRNKVRVGGVVGEEFWTVRGKIRKELGEEDVAVRLAGVDGDGIRGGNMGMGGVAGNGKAAR